ncbi:MAG: cation:proton antiporter [Thaumarchaeota archaeon]|nr:cation:proton antiporter [Nitrososphaerota archaeon]
MRELWIILLIVISGVLSLELGLSTAILEIMAGVIGGNLFEIGSLTWIDFMSNYGILGLMFLAGLEVDKDELKRNAKESLIIASSSYFIPFILIFAVTIPILGFDLRKSAIVGIALSTTSLALLYPILREKGLLNLELGHVILASAMLIDIWSMISLTVIFAAVNFFTAIFFVVLVFFMWYAPKLGRWLFARYRENLSEIELKFLLLILLALVFFAERVMVSEAVLAFMMGFLFSEVLEEHGALVDKLKGIVFAFFSPIFFFKAGSYMKFSIMNSTSLLLAALLLPLAFFSKYYSSKIAFRKLRGGAKSLSKFVGVVFNFRLTFGIISALFGLKAGIISNETYTAIITVIIISALISSLLTKKEEKQA